MMALVVGVRDRAALARACDLVARDIGEDAHAGRLCLPLAWLRGRARRRRLARRSRRSPANGRLLAEADRLYLLGE